MTHPWKSTDENNVIIDIKSLVISLLADNISSPSTSIIFVNNANVFILMGL